MPLTTYVANEVLTAASLNNNFTFATAQGGLVRVGGGTVGTSGSVAYSSVFSSTYSSYYIIGSNLDCSSTTTFTFILTGITAGYYTNRIIQQYNGGASTASLVANNAANSGAIGRVSTTQGAMFSMVLTNPNAAQYKTWTSTASEPDSAGFYITAGGFIGSTTQATGFTFSLDAGTLAGGRFDIYGYNES